jgi:hypothetical protein
VGENTAQTGKAKPQPKCKGKKLPKNQKIEAGQSKVIPFIRV